MTKAVDLRRCVLRSRMHKSRLCAIGIDCHGSDPQSAAEFWAAALGRQVRETQGKYCTLEDRPNQPITFVQSVEHASRVHLDIETDDLDAEVARLEALGAKRLAKVETWWVMEAPTGHRFCVVRAQRGPLPDDANVWT